MAAAQVQGTAVHPLIGRNHMSVHCGLYDPEDRRELKKIIEKHHSYTGSRIAKELL